jgi:hypothetical protein
VTPFVGLQPGTGHLRGAGGTPIECRREGASTHWFLEGRELTNGDALELRMRGHVGWVPVTVAGLPQRVEVEWTAADGHALRATLSDGVAVRWP